MNNPKIGRYGDNKKPKLTLSGAEARQPFGKIYGLGNDYYCVGDVFPMPGWEDELAGLRREVGGAKAKPRVKAED
ncbi:hypothetical protein LCGC14_3060330 [marine sediment metagenome]|uniref:Uncharacterized protein n=1 Tax=marine sediment metagenome TaxID=412755 RepID=A0A0F8X7F8_9ZZZZ